MNPENQEKRFNEEELKSLVTVYTLYTDLLNRALDLQIDMINSNNVALIPYRKVIDEWIKDFEYMNSKVKQMYNEGEIH